MLDVKSYHSAPHSFVEAYLTWPPELSYRRAHNHLVMEIQERCRLIGIDPHGETQVAAPTAFNTLVDLASKRWLVLIDEQRTKVGLGPYPRSVATSWKHPSLPQIESGGSSAVQE